MKIDKLLDIKNIPEEECKVCFVHEYAYKMIDNEMVECPHCLEKINFDFLKSTFEHLVVGEANYVDGDH